MTSATFDCITAKRCFEIECVDEGRNHHENAANATIIECKTTNVECGNNCNDGGFDVSFRVACTIACLKEASGPNTT